MSPEETRVMTPHAASDSVATVLRPVEVAPHGIPPGTLLVNTYRVERLLGGGGMGEVYLARHTGLGTLHAIKVIRPAMAMDRQVMDLFYREARVLRGVRHDAVVSYDGFVRDDQGRDYLVMEYAEGPSLADRLRREPLSPRDVLALRDRLAAGLAEAHRQGAVHRDISPDNVILPGNRIEAAKLIDFGVCKLTDPNQETIIGSSFAGKYRYASPEQLGLFDGTVDARSDIYSLGLILAAAAQGRPLGMGETVEAALRSRQTVPDLNGVPASLREWLSAMLQPDPARRPASMDALLERWPAADGQRSTPRAARTPKGNGEQSARSGRGLGWVIGLILLVSAAGGLYWLLRPLPPLDIKQTAGSGSPTIEARRPGRCRGRIPAGVAGPNGIGFGWEHGGTGRVGPGGPAGRGICARPEASGFGSASPGRGYLDPRPGAAQGGEARPGLRPRARTGEFRARTRRLRPRGDVRSVALVPGPLALLQAERGQGPGLVPPRGGCGGTGDRRPTQGAR